MMDRCKERWRHCGIAALVLLGCWAVFAPAGEPPAGESEWVFALEEVSTFELPGETFALGQEVPCHDRPDPEVRACPTLQSAKPLYGLVQVGSYFEEKKPQCTFHFVADESGGTGTGYDRLYVDVNSDRDLSNDAPVGRWQDPPAILLRRYTSDAYIACFAGIGLPLPFGSQGVRPMEAMARLRVTKAGSGTMSLVPMKARRGQIQIAGREYDVILAHPREIVGWRDHPETTLLLTPRGEPGAQTKPAGEAPASLMAIRRLPQGTQANAGEAYYRFTATPAGDRLTVRRYDGPMGVFEIGVGGRALDRADVSVSGWLWSSVAGVEVTGPKCLLPAGDYLAFPLTIRYGGLHLTMQTNSHADGQFRGKFYQQRVCPIRIRPDKPYVLDFSNQPQVMFATPAKDSRVQVGERLFVYAVLIDPVLDFAVSGLTYTPPGPPDRPVRPASDAQGSGDSTLAPRVVIARANGQVVDQGTTRYG